jgi:hypothetical protein
MATYYWVGGDGTWDNVNTANWSNATGGASGFGPPLAADTVNFDSNSGTGTCTTAATAAAANATLNSSTLALTLGANLTISTTFGLLLGNLSLTGNSGNWTLTCATFATNGSGVRSIAFGTGNITLTGNNATIWNGSTSTNFSYTGTPTVNATYSGSTGTRTFSATTGVTETNAININVTAGTDIISPPANVKNFNLSGFKGTFTIGTSGTRVLYGNLTLDAGLTIPAGGTILSFNATSGTKTITTNGVSIDTPLTFNGVGGTFQLQDNLTVGSTRTVTLTNGTLDLNSKTLSCGLCNGNNSNTRSILFGTGNIALTGTGTVWNFATLTGFTYTGTSQINFINPASSGTRTINHGLLGGGSESTALNFNISAGTDTISTNSAIYAKNFNTSGFSGTITNQSRVIYGNFTSDVSTIWAAGTSGTTFAGTSGTQQITTNGVTLDYPLTFNGIGGTFAFADALTQGSTRAFTITNGTVKLKAGATSTVGAFTTSGSNQKYLQSTTAGSQATLSQASGTVTVSYLTIKDIAATGGATWNAYVDYNNVDQGDNTGWDFSNSPAIDNEFPIALRSFTQPKRF